MHPPPVDFARYAEVDLLRGIAVLMVAVYHTSFVLRFLGLIPLEVYTGGWRLLALSTGGLFLFPVGLSLSLSAARSALPGGRPDYAKFLKRRSCASSPTDS
ncbi:MAG: heparan-alpha-glucosaminide N-acetyltransferase domain-containing protein [Methanoculleaceae archaeon]